MIQAVIFDLDGTLIDLPINYEKLSKQFGKIMKTDRIHPITETISQLDEKTKSDIFKIWEKAEVTALEHMKVNDEGMLLYKKYSLKPKALVTMQSKKLAQKVTEALSLSFNFAVTREDSLDRVEQLTVAIRQLDVDFHNILFIGNTTGDQHAAEKVNCQFLGVGQ